MKRPEFSEERVAYALRQVEAGTSVPDVCRQLGVSEATFMSGKKKYAHLGVSELRRLRGEAYASGPAHDSPAQPLALVAR